MKTRLGVLLAISLLIILALSLAACERDRPAPTPTLSPEAGASAGGGTPKANVTTIALPAEAGGETTGSTPEAGTTPEPATGETAPAAAESGGAPAANASGPIEYTVQQGDTIANLARKYGVTQAAIISLNGLTNADLLAPGQKLKIPAQTTAPSAGTGTTGTTGDTYTVQAGDTLTAIAQQLGVSREDLQAANNISNADQIYAGQVLRIPKGSSQPAATAAPATGQASQEKYVVQRGDTLARIAAKFGVTIAQLKQANNIANADQIYSGQELIIPK